MYIAFQIFFPLEMDVALYIIKLKSQFFTQERFEKCLERIGPEAQEKIKNSPN